MTSSYSVPHVGEYPSKIKGGILHLLLKSGRDLAITYIDLRSPWSLRGMTLGLYKIPLALKKELQEPSSPMPHDLHTIRLMITFIPWV
jgi:hypothetical protein